MNHKLRRRIGIGLMSVAAFAGGGASGSW